MEYPLTLRALRAQENQGWHIGDALVDELVVRADGRVAPGEYARCQCWLEEHGYTVTTGYLADLRTTSVAFPTARSRRFKLPHRHYLEAARTKATAQQREAWLATAEKEGQTLRKLSAAITGREWPDSTRERLRSAVLAEPELLAETLRDNPTMVAEAIKHHPEIADAVVGNADAHVAVIRASGRKAEENSVGPQPSRHQNVPEPLARLMALLNIAAVDRETEVMERKLMDFVGDYVWRPGEEEALLAKLTTSRTRIDNAITLISFKVPGGVS